MHALLGDLAHLAERIHLKTARIGQDRPLPVHEIVQIAMRPDDLGAGPQPQVEGVAENDLGAQALQLFGRHGLDGAVGADRHECGGLDGPAAKMQAATARIAILTQTLKSQLTPR